MRTSDKRQTDKNVAFVIMPFATLLVPQLGVSLLKSALEKIGVQSDILYLNLSFGERIGRSFYEWLKDSDPRFQLAEWVFSRALNGEDWDKEPPFVEWLQSEVLKTDNPCEDLDVSLSHFREAHRLAGEYIEACVNDVDWQPYAIIGFSVCNMQNVASLALAKRIKERWPEKIIVFGGSNCEGAMGLALHENYPFIDYVCRGESDVLFPALVESLLQHKSLPEMNGLIYRDDIGQSICVGSGAVPITDLDSLPPPNFDDFFAAINSCSLSLEDEIILCAETSRGCWWGQKQQCSFCGVNGENLVFRSKSPDQAVKEITELTKKYGVKHFWISDSILDMKYFHQFVPMVINSDPPVFLAYEIKANIRKNQLRLLKEAGIGRLTVGIESLSTPILNLMGKGVNAIQNVQLLKWGTELGLTLSWNFLFGFPGEPQEEYARVVDLIPPLLHLHPPGGYGCIRLERFSPYFSSPSDLGICNVRASDGYRYAYDLPSEELFKIAYNFDFAYIDGRNPDDYTESLIIQLDQWRKNFRPGSLFSITKNGKLSVYDRRNGQPEKVWHLGEIEKALFDYCDEAHTLKRIHRQLVDLAYDISVTELTEKLDGYVDEGLFYRDGDWYISLVIPSDPIIQEHCSEEVLELAFAELFAELTGPRKQICE